MNLPIRGNLLTPLATLAVAAGLLLNAACGSTSVVERQPGPPGPDEPAPVVSAPGAGADNPTPVPLGRLALSVEPAPVAQGGEVRLSGRGFGPNEVVVVSASSEQEREPMELARANSGSDGTLGPLTVGLPPELISGRHDVQAVGATTGRASSGVVWIQARDPWINLPEIEMAPNGELGFIAGGFGAAETVSISLRAREKKQGGDDAAPRPTATVEPVELATAAADQAGNLTWLQVKTPRVPAGEYSLVLTGPTSGRELRRDVIVKPFTPVAELDPWAGPPGTKLKVNARGFAPGELVRIYLDEDPQPAASPVVDQWGNFWAAGPARVAYGAREKVIVTLQGADSHTLIHLDFKVLEPKPWLELTAWWGPPDAPVGFGGGGWAPGEKVSIHLGSALGPAVASGIADDYGWLRSSSFARVPRDADGDVAFAAVGQESGAWATATFKLVLPFGLKPGR